MELKEQFEKETGIRKPMTRTHEAYAYYYEKYSEWLQCKVKNIGDFRDDNNRESQQEWLGS